MREKMERLVALQTVDLKIQEMERAREEIPQRIASLEEEFGKEEEKVKGPLKDLQPDLVTF